MPLTGSHFDRIYRVILAAYTRDELRRALRVCMDLSLNDYAPDKGFADQLWALIEWAVRQDRVKDLIRCAHRNNNTNVELAALWRDAQTWDWTRQASEPAPSASTAPGHNTALLTGSGAIAQQGGVAAGAGGVAVGGDYYVNVNIGAIVSGDTNRRKAELEYLDKLLSDCKTWASKYTRLPGVAEVWEQYDRPKLVTGDPFIDAEYERILVQNSERERRTVRVPVDNLLDAVGTYKRMVILGEPGSGKTTTLRRLTNDYSAAAQQDPSALIPIFVPLGGYSGQETALDYVARHFGSLGAHLAAYLHSRRIVLLLDALNEMPRANYPERVGRIQKLLDDFPDTPLIVTCRALDYVETLNLEKLQVKPLDPIHQYDFLCRHLDESKAENLFWEMAGKDVVSLWDVWQQLGHTFAAFWTGADVPQDVSRKVSHAQKKTIAFAAIWSFTAVDGTWRQLLPALFNCINLL